MATAKPGQEFHVLSQSTGSSVVGRCQLLVMFRMCLLVTGFGNGFEVDVKGLEKPEGGLQRPEHVN